MSYIQEHYGPEVVLELHELRMAPCKVTNAELARTLERHRRMA